MKTLSVGDRVIWRGAWGSKDPQPATVLCIEKDCVDKEGTEVAQIPWESTDTSGVVVILDNGHWAYGYQIAPVPEGAPNGQPVL